MPTKRDLLAQLTRDELLAILEHFELAADRRSPAAMLEAIASSKKAKLGPVLEGYARDRLKELCTALGLDSSGREKAPLVERLLGKAPSDTPKAERMVLPGFDDIPAKKPAKAKTKGKAKDGDKERRRGDQPESEAAVAGTLKAALQQFVLGAAGGFTGRDAHIAFATRLLECFGWKDGRPAGAELPRSFTIADAGQRIEREVALWWLERRTLMEVAAHDAVLDFAWKELVRVCLQLDPVPQYVVLTNQRDLHLYDLARDREAPRLAIRIDDLPKYSEAFPFFTAKWVPGATPKIVNVEKVSEEVADLVARVYRSVRAQHPTRERDVIRFTLQCITAMFAEDIGLLPRNYFTLLLYEGAKNNDVEQRLRTLFEQMNTPGLPVPRTVPYFNGGLFTDVVTLPLGPAQLMALTKAAEANWSYVDPHIFGSVFQGIMDDAERHASGAHYTAHDDIMRVVGPTIVEPWRKRIQAATTLTELTELRKELFAFRVLDPACGSGNFLYVAFRELYRLDTELLARTREFPSTASKLSWNAGISASNFFGIDINPFAVELAKVTLNIAKKIAFEERKTQAFALASQIEIDIDPSLPLDNLDDNIVCKDALFMEWPKAHAIVGNPPFVAGTSIKGELGSPYVERLRAAFPDVKGRADFCSYWFRRAHDRLPEGGRAGLVGTSGIRVGNSREASLDYIAGNRGTIVNAVSSRVWPGDAAVDVAMVNWVRGECEGPYPLEVDGQILLVARIETHLQLHADVSTAKDLAANVLAPAEGVQFGHAAFRVRRSTFSPELVRKGRVVRPVATGDDLLRSRLSSEPDYCVDLRGANTEANAKAIGGIAFDYLKRELFPVIKDRAERADRAGQPDHYSAWLHYWWKPRRGREEFFVMVKDHVRMLVCPKVSSRPAFAFISNHFVPNDTLKLFAFDDDYSFGIMQSRLHWEWTKARGSRVRSDIQYTAAVWQTFPWPQDPTDEQVAAVAEAGRALRRTRDTLMAENGWSLRQLYQAAEVEGSHPLKDAQIALDSAVADAYGIPPDQAPIAFLLELNQLVAEDEEQGRKVRGPGLPDHLDPKDPRWMSTDCIEPPPMEN